MQLLRWCVWELYDTDDRWMKGSPFTHWISVNAPPACHTRPYCITRRGSCQLFVWIPINCSPWQQPLFLGQQIKLWWINSQPGEVSKSLSSCCEMKTEKCPCFEKDLMHSFELMSNIVFAYICIYICLIKRHSTVLLCVYSIYVHMSYFFSCRDFTWKCCRIRVAPRRTGMLFKATVPLWGTRWWWTLAAGPASSACSALSWLNPQW